MKKYIPLLAVLIIFSCKQKEDRAAREDKTTVLHPSVIHDVEPVDSTTGERLILPRDLSIDSTNSYSQFFMDSLDMIKFFEQNKIHDTIRRRITSFYNTRNYQFAWFSKDGIQEDTRGFWNMHSYYTTYENEKVLVDSPLIKTMNRYLAADDFAADSTFGAANPKVLDTELKLTHHFIMYTLLNYDHGYVQRNEIEHFIPYKKQDPQLVADSLANYFKSKDYYGDVNIAYTRLKDELIKLVEIKNAGGWKPINAELKIPDSAGVGSKDIIALRERLRITGEYTGYDSTNTMDSALIGAVKLVQAKYGYKQTGKLTSAQVKDLNVPVEKRIEQVLINMNRSKWMVNPPQGKFINVNIPEFVLHVRENNEKVFDMRVVVGKEGTNTVNFTGNLNTIVFSPYWNVPLSITKNEILPGIRRRGNAYLRRQNMEIYGSWGNGIPRVRQKPGPKNSLGLVKFLFPNSYDIYFHDSPAKSLFNLDKRAYSHGCIRLAEPKKFASYLLQHDSTWTSEKIDSLMHLKNEKWVRLKNPVPVMITYYTAWVDEDNLLHFADDIYKKDLLMKSKMFISKNVSKPKPSVTIKPVVKPLKDSSKKKVEEIKQDSV